MKIYIEQVPEDVDFSEYPQGTIFIFDDRPIERDPVSHELIRPKRKPLIYPEDCK